MTAALEQQVADQVAHVLKVAVEEENSHLQKLHNERQEKAKKEWIDAKQQRRVARRREREIAKQKLEEMRVAETPESIEIVQPKESNKFERV
jgi:hypothetical protein